MQTHTDKHAGKSKPAEKKKLNRPIIPPIVMSVIISDASIFSDTDKKNEFLTKLKQHPSSVFDQIKADVEKIVNKASVGLEIHIIIDNKNVATQEIMSALREKYKKEIAKIKVIYHIAH